MTRRLDLPPGLAISIATDSIYDRLKSKSLPESLARDAGLSGTPSLVAAVERRPRRHGLSIGRNGHISVSVANQSEQSVSLPVIIDFFAQGRGQRERRVERLGRHCTTGPVDRDDPTSSARRLRTVSRAGADRWQGRPLEMRFLLRNSAVEAEFLHRRESHVRLLQLRVAPALRGLDAAGQRAGQTSLRPRNDGEWFRTEEWYVQNRTGAVGNGGGYNEFTGESCGFGWGPFFTSNYYCPDQMGLMPNGQPVLHYVADGLRMRAFPEPVRTEVADFWANYWVQARWNSLANFREWLAVNDPAAAARFTPQTLAEARAMVAGPLAREYDRWQTAVIIGGWGAARAAFPAGSQLWSQAEVCGVASDRSAPATELVRFLARRDAAADIDPGTSRVGMGFRYRAYLEGTTAAFAPDDVHFNATCIRHMYNTNDQRMRNMGNCTPETFRAFASETVWGAAVRPDGTLRSILDTPYSELEIGAATGLNAGNRIYNQTYRLGAFVEPERALGLLWVAVGERETRLSSRQVFETLRDSGVPLGRDDFAEAIVRRTAERCGGRCFPPASIGCRQDAGRPAVVGGERNARGLPDSAAMRDDPDQASQGRRGDRPAVLEAERCERLLLGLHAADGAGTHRADRPRHRAIRSTPARARRSTDFAPAAGPSLWCRTCGESRERPRSPCRSYERAAGHCRRR